VEKNGDEQHAKQVATRKPDASLRRQKKCESEAEQKIGFARAMGASSSVWFFAEGKCGAMVCSKKSEPRKNPART